MLAGGLFAGECGLDAALQYESEFLSNFTPTCEAIGRSWYTVWSVGADPKSKP